MIRGEYYHDYGRDSRSSPSSWIRERLQLATLSVSRHEADYPVNCSVTTIYHCPTRNVTVSFTEYPERDYLPACMNAASIKGEFIMSAYGKREDVAAIEELIRDIIARQPNAKVESA